MEKNLIVIISNRLTDQERRLLRNLWNKHKTWHVLMDDNIVVRTADSPKQLFEKIALIIPGTTVFIDEVSDNRYGWLPEEAWRWFNRKIEESE